MLLATVATFFLPELHNVPLILVALLLGAGLAWWSAGKVAITDMPQMVAVYNGMGGGAAALIAAVEFTSPEPPTGLHATLAMMGAFIGSIAFSGSVMAFAKLQGIMKRAVRWPAQNVGNVVHSLVTLALGIAIVNPLGSEWLYTDDASDAQAEADETDQRALHDEHHHDAHRAGAERAQQLLAVVARRAL